MKRLLLFISRLVTCSEHLRDVMIELFKKLSVEHQQELVALFTAAVNAAIASNPKLAAGVAIAQSVVAILPESTTVNPAASASPPYVPSGVHLDIGDRFPGLLDHRMEIEPLNNSSTSRP